MNLNAKIFLAGHRGMVGSNIYKSLLDSGFVSKNIVVKTREELDLTNQAKVMSFFEKEKIDQVYMAAAKVGGILANKINPAIFIYENLMIQTNIINCSFIYGIKKLLFLGSSCIYPKNVPQPFKEEALLSGYLEPTNEAYAIAKITGIKMCESYNIQYGKEYDIDYRSIMPTNLYGPGDNYHPENSHVIPGLIWKFYQGKKKDCENVKIWGTGKPKREFLYVNDLALSAIHVMNMKKSQYQNITQKTCSHINVGSGEEISIKELAILIAQIVKYEGQIIFDISMPDGIKRKIMNNSKILNTGWKPKYSLKDGIIETYKNFLEIQND